MHQIGFGTKYEYSQLVGGIELPVELSMGGQSFSLRAKLDTGSTYCIFQREYAEALGLEVETGQFQRMSTATGYFDTYGHDVQISCLGHSTQATVYFISTPGVIRNVLGRIGWLDRHRVALIDHDLVCYLSDYNDANP